MNREELQKKVLSEFIKLSNIMLEWATGLGKSKVAIDVVEETSREVLMGNNTPSILLLVAETSHKSNWAEEFNKWDKEFLLQNVVMECYHSIGKHENKHYDLVIMDEAHHLSESRMHILSTMTADRTVVLSATLKPHIKDALTDLYGEYFVSTVTLGDAIDEGILPKPRIVVIPLSLEENIQSEEIVIEWGRKAKRKELKFEYHELGRIQGLRKKGLLAVKAVAKVTPSQKYEYLNKQVDYWQKRYFRTNDDRHKMSWLMAGLQRKLFLGSQKSDKVREVLTKLEGMKYVCFCSSIEQAEELGKETAIHSKKKESLSLIRQFNQGTIRTLFPVGMTQEGNNLAGIEAGVIIQLDGETRGFIQKMGRTMRASDPLQVIFFIRGTRDEDYLSKALEGFNEEYYRVIEWKDVMKYDNLFR